MLQSTRSEEPSRVIPVVQTFPMFVAILAVPLLRESLGYIDWVSILMTVAGAVQQGPVSLVTAILSVRPALVFIYAAVQFVRVS